MRTGVFGNLRTNNRKEVRINFLKAFGCGIGHVVYTIVYKCS